MSETKEEIIEEYNPLLLSVSKIEGVLILLIVYWVLLGTLLFFGKIDMAAFERLFLSVSIVLPLLKIFIDQNKTD